MQFKKVIVGFILTLLVGITLGLVGSGGSILIIPILVYFFGIDILSATTYSLFIIGITSFLGSYTKMKEFKPNPKIILTFGVASALMMLITRSLILPKIPNQIIILSKTIDKTELISILFIVILFFAGMKMFKSNQDNLSNSTEKLNFFVLGIQGILIGFISGIIGAGGGFLIIPSLIYFAKMKIKEAISTSLIIVTFSSLIGFLGDFQVYAQLNWKLLIALTLISISGIIMGSKFQKFVNPNSLKKGLGAFIFIVSFMMFYKTFI